MHSPQQTPLTALCLGAMVTALSVLDHAWLSLPLHLEEAAATSAFPLQLLAPAARGVPGGLIKFDLFLSVKVSPPTSTVPRSLSLPPQRWGAFRAASQAPRGLNSVQSQGGRMGVFP